jgi:hypothetical protein
MLKSQMKYHVFHPCVTVDKQKMKQCISNLFLWKKQLGVTTTNSLACMFLFSRTISYWNKKIYTVNIFVFSIPSVILGVL